MSGSQEDLREEEAAAAVSGGDQARVQVQGHRVIAHLYITLLHSHPATRPFCVTDTALSSCHAVCVTTMNWFEISLSSI